MSLRIRRGTDAERQTVTFLEGELVYTTDTKKVFVGDGATLGGVSVDTAAGSIDNLTDVNIAGIVPGQVLQWNGAAFIPGNRDKESVFGDDSTLLVDTINSAIVLDGTVRGHIVPDQNIAYDLGSASNRFRDLYLSGTTIDLGGTTISVSGGKINFSDPVQAEFELSQNMDLKNYYITSSDASPNISLRPGAGANMNVASVAGVKAFEVDLNTNRFGAPTNGTAVLQLPVFSASDYTNHSGNVALGQVVFDNPTKTLKLYNGTSWVGIAGSGGGSGIVEGQTYDINILGNVLDGSSTIMVNTATGRFSGSLDGDIVGDVLATDSTKIIDHFNSRVYADRIDILGAVVADDVQTNYGTITDLTVTDFYATNVQITGSLKAPSITSTFKGSFFADNSTTIIDGITGNVNANAITTPTVSVGIINPEIAANGLEFKTPEDVGKFIIRRTSAGAITDGTTLGRIIFAKDEGGTETSLFTNSANGNQWLITPSPGGTPDFNNYLKVYSNGNVQISVAGELANAPGDAKLEVGGAIRYTPMTTTTRDALTATAGMVVFNTTDTKLQVYTGSGWVDLH